MIQNNTAVHIHSIASTCSISFKRIRTAFRYDSKEIHLCTNYSQYYSQAFIMYAQQRIVSIPVTICIQSFLACINMMCPANYLLFYIIPEFYIICSILCWHHKLFQNSSWFWAHILFTTWLTKLAYVTKSQWRQECFATKQLGFSSIPSTISKFY